MDDNLLAFRVLNPIKLFWKTLAIVPDWNRRKFSWLRGTVVTSNTKYSSTTSTENRAVRLSTGETGTVELPTTQTTAVHEFWLKTPQGEIHVQLTNDYTSVYRGQTLTLIYYGNTLVAYIVHDTREEFVIEYSLRKLAGRPSFGMTLLQCFLIFPVIIALLSLIPTLLLAGLLGAANPQADPHRVMVRAQLLMIIPLSLLNVAWLFIGYPVRFVLYLWRRFVLEPKILKEVAARRGYQRAG